MGLGRKAFGGGEGEETPEAIPETPLVSRKTTKLDPKAFLLSSKTQPLYEDETPESVPAEGILGKAKAGVGKFMGGISGAASKMFGGGDRAEEDIAGGEVGKEKGFVEGIGSGIKGLFGGGGVEAPEEGFGLLHTDLIGIHGLLETFVSAATSEGSIFVHDVRMGDKMDEQTDQLVEDLEPETIDASVQREGDIESKIPFIGGKKKKGKKGKGLMAMLGMGGAGPAGAGGFGVKLGGIMKGIGAGAIILAGIASLAHIAYEGLQGWKAAAEGKWDAGKVEGAIGGALGGMGSGGKNAAKQAAKGAAVGAMIGMVGGPVGMIVGAVVGGAIGGIAGFVGGKKIAEWLTETKKTIQDVVDLPSIMTDEQKESAKEEIAAAKVAATGIEKSLKTLRAELESSDTDYKRRIELRKMIAGKEKQINEKRNFAATEARRIAESDLAERDKILNNDRQTEFAFSQQLMQAQQAVGIAKNKVFWAKLIHGEGSAEHNEALKIWEDRKLAVADATQQLADQTTLRKEHEVSRAALRTEIDKEHRTTMGNVRLFFKGETDWQTNMGKTWRSFTGSLGQMFKDYIYDPGQSGGPPGTGTPMKIFGIELKWPTINLPSWEDISLPAWLSGDWWTTKWDEWTMTLPSWSDITAKIPKWLGGTKEGTSSWSELMNFSKWTLPAFPTWETIKAWMPEWMTDPVGWIKGIFSRGDESAKIEERMLKRTKTQTKLGGEKKELEADLKAAGAERSAAKQKLTDYDTRIDELLAIAEKKAGKAVSIEDITSTRKNVGLDYNQKNELKRTLKAREELEEVTPIGMSTEEKEIQIKIAEVDAESLVLQTEQAADQKLLSSLVHKSVPHIKVMTLDDSSKPPMALAASVGDKQVDMSTIEGRRAFLASATDEEWAQMFQTMQGKGVAYAGGGAGVLQRQTEMRLEGIEDYGGTPESVRRDAKIETLDYMFSSTQSARNAMSTESTGDKFKESFGSFSKNINSIGDVVQVMISTLQTEGTGHDINTIGDSLKEISWDQWKGNLEMLRSLGIYTIEDLDRLQELTGSAYVSTSGGRGSGDYLRTAQPQDLGATATITGAGSGGGGNAIIVNNITNATGGSTSAPTSVTNMNIMAGVNDPHTSKQPSHVFGKY
jgi:hypothetical protein